MRLFSSNWHIEINKIDVLSDYTLEVTQNNGDITTVSATSMIFNLFIEIGKWIVGMLVGYAVNKYMEKKQKALMNKLNMDIDQAMELLCYDLETKEKIKQLHEKRLKLVEKCAIIYYNDIRFFISIIQWGAINGSIV